MNVQECGFVLQAVRTPPHGISLKKAPPLFQSRQFSNFSLFLTRLQFNKPFWDTHPVSNSDSGLFEVQGDPGVIKVLHRY